MAVITVCYIDESGRCGPAWADKKDNPIVIPEENNSELISLPRNWYAARTKSNFEKKALEWLVKHHFEAFFPRIKVRKRWSDRFKTLMRPMFPGYVFINFEFNASTNLEVVKGPGIVNIVRFDNRPAVISLEEIANLKILDGTDIHVQQTRYLKRGEKVRILEGPLAGLVGIFQHYKNSGDRIVVSVDFLRQSIAAEIEGYAVERIESP